MSAIIIKCDHQAKYEAGSMSLSRSCLSLFVYLDWGRAGHSHQRGVSTRARDSESISTQLSFLRHEKQREEPSLVQVWGEDDIK